MIRAFDIVELAPKVYGGRLRIGAAWMIIRVSGSVRFQHNIGAALAERRPGSRVFLWSWSGLHPLTHTHINEDRTFGSAFQFREFLGPGVRFGPDSRDEVGIRLQHARNGGIRNRNDGLTCGSVAVRYNFQ